MKLLNRTNFFLAKHLYNARRPVLWASGGKDSTVLLHLCRPWAKKMTILHGYKDDGWPGVTELLKAHCVAWGYQDVQIIHPWLTFPAYVEQYGWPVDVVPTALEGGTAVAESVYRTSHIRIASWWHCTFVRGIYPLMLATAKHGADMVFTGSRLSDAPNNTMFQTEIAQRHPTGWQRFNPLSEWTSEDIWTYIETHTIDLPPHYRWKRSATYEVPDCLSCTWQVEHWHMLKQHYPEEYARRWPTVEPVYAALSKELVCQAQQIQGMFCG